MHELVKIICPVHGIFEQTPNSHLKKHGCSKCKISKGEEKIKIFLDKRDIRYEREKKFKDLKWKNYLRFDFYLPNYNTIIEYDGIQHFKPIKCFGGLKGFLERKSKDNKKNSFCERKGIYLIRISYKDFLNIDEILYKNLRE